MCSSLSTLLVKHRQFHESGQLKPDAPSYSSHYLDAYLMYKDASVFMREARALEAYYQNCVIYVNPCELVVGRIVSYEPAGFHIGGGTYINGWTLPRYIEHYQLTTEQQEELEQKLELVRARKFMAPWEEGFDRYHSDLFTSEERNCIDTGASSSTFFGGHLVIDFETLLQKGVSYYRNLLNQKIAEAAEEQLDFYQAMLITLDAFCTLIRRTAEECGRLADICDGDERNNMLQLHHDLLHISQEAPCSFRQALQLVWFAHYCNSSDSFGRFDKYLRPFFEADIASGALTAEDALALLCGLMIKIDEDGAIQNMTIGGCMPDGSQNFTDLTLLVMKATREMKYKGPNLSIRINDQMPELFWDEIAKNLGVGQGLPAIYNESVMLEWLRKLGIPTEDARDFCLAGCSQIMIPGKSQFVNDIGMMNAAKVLELTLYNGVDAGMSGLEFPFKTGVVDDFTTFEELFERYLEQLRYYAKIQADVNNKVVALYGKNEGYNFRTLLTQGCLEQGKGVFVGGATYNHIQLECIGITNAADSLAGIKKAVFEDRIVTMTELLDALRNDFEGQESLQAYLKNKAPKVGNDIDEVDDIRTRITEVLYGALRQQKSIIGGQYIPGEVIFTAHDGQGRLTGATPDGRKKGTVLADSACASQGSDRCGPTALINSQLKIPVDEILTSVVLNIKFLKPQWERDRAKNIALLRTFFLQGGQQVQVNVCDQALLQKAYENPQDYPGLVVRVGGYSDYFRNLSQELQRDIIERTAY